jgi:hypothetical protein
MLFRRACFETIGGFDLTPEINDDWVNWLRIARAGYLFECLDESLAFIRRHGGNITRTQAWRVITWRLNALDKICSETAVSEGVKNKAYASVYWIGTVQALADNDLGKADEWWLKTVQSDPAILTLDETYFALIAGGGLRDETNTFSDLQQGHRVAVSLIDEAYTTLGEQVPMSRPAAYAHADLALARLAYARNESPIARASLLRALSRAPAFALDPSRLKWWPRMLMGRDVIRALRRAWPSEQGDLS